MFDKKQIEVAAEKLMLNRHGIMNGYSMDYCREMVEEVAQYLTESKTEGVSYAQILSEKEKD